MSPNGQLGTATVAERGAHKAECVRRRERPVERAVDESVRWYGNQGSEEGNEDEL